MTVKELREELAGCSDDTLVVVANSDGNAFTPLGEVNRAIYLMTSTWHGKVYDLDHSNAKNGVPCVVLDPAN